MTTERLPSAMLLRLMVEVGDQALVHAAQGRPELIRALRERWEDLKMRAEVTLR